MKLWPVNRNIAASHTDSPDVFLWDFNDQECAPYKENTDANVPDLLLKGHTADAKYALSWSHQSPRVASGGEDM